MKIRSKRHLKSDADNELKEAAEWFLDIESESLSPREMDKFADWFEADVANRKKLDMITSVWTAMHELKDDPMVVRTLEKSQAKEHTETGGKWFKEWAFHLTKFRYAAVAAVLFLIAGGIWLAQQNPNQPEIYKTSVGEQKTIYLSDGSTIYLDTNTSVSASFTGKSRYIEFSGGRAFFSVAHEPKRPFIVMTDRLVIQAMGTEFEVYKKNEDKTSVSVSNGHVQIQQADKKSRLNMNKGLSIPAVQPKPEQKFLARISGESILSSELLGPGQDIEVNNQTAEYTINPFDFENGGEWRKGRLNFQNKPLQVVIEELNRYLSNEIIIEDDLKDLNVNVYFNLKHRKDFVATLEKAYPITSRTASNGQIVLLRQRSETVVKSYKSTKDNN
jgi:transmembrane sensor